MGASCVAAIEPGYDELPMRLQLRDAPVKLQDVEGLTELPVSSMLWNGHKQSIFEANLENWARRQSCALDEALSFAATNEAWPMHACVGAPTAPCSHIVSGVTGACGRVAAAAATSTTEGLHDRGGECRELEALQRGPVRAPRPRMVPAVPATPAPPAAPGPRTPRVAAAVAPVVPFSAAGGRSPRRPAQMCGGLCCREPVGFPETVIILQQEPVLHN
uniref:Uncharacterized protein n=1 Tax=Pyrodinium bahamense TaxID=73915 RepID=A0A7S0AIE3_9DINO